MKFSVIIPVHNAEKYIREATDSITAQRLADDTSMEVLLVENVFYVKERYYNNKVVV